MRALLSSVALATLTIGCSGLEAARFQTCTSDDQCTEGQICFPEGCGDPGAGLVVEVTGDNATGIYAQEFPVTDGGLRPKMDFTIAGPLSITGELLREREATPNPNNRTAYRDPVLIRAVGSSELLPGINRPYEARFSQTERGAYAMSVGAGKYKVTAYPQDTSIPPVMVDDVAVSAEKTSNASFVFPAIEGVVTISGRVIKRHIDGTPPHDIPITQAAVDLQAVDLTTGEPLSQRVPVSSGTVGSRGDFILTMHPRALDVNAVVLVVSPRESGALVPTKRFIVFAPYPTAITLEMGDFGDPLPQVKGTVLDTSGAPVANASVMVDIRIGTDSTFRSKTTMTNADGVFALDLLTPSDDKIFRATVIPPPGMNAGVAVLPITIVTDSKGLASFQPSKFVCPNRTTIDAFIMTPTGAPLAGAQVQATLRTGLSTTVALDDVFADADMNGAFHMALDPGVWSLSISGSGGVARSVRLVTIDNNDEAIRLPDIVMPKGRRVSGVVQSELKGMPNATIRYFRVAPIDGVMTSLLLGSAIADETGAYSVLLPTR